MENMMVSGAASLVDDLQSHAAEQVVYRRGAAAIDWTATIGSTQYEAEDNGILVTKHTDADFIGRVLGLVVGGTFLEPVKGDLIEWRRGGILETYEVMALPGLQCFRIDATGQIVRIHAKRITRA